MVAGKLWAGLWRRGGALKIENRDSASCNAANPYIESSKKKQSLIHMATEADCTDKDFHFMIKLFREKFKQRTSFDEQK